MRSNFTISKELAQNAFKQTPNASSLFTLDQIFEARVRLFTLLW